MKNILFIAIVFIAFGCTSEVFELPQNNPNPTDSVIIDRCDTLDITYQNKVKKIIDDNCVVCHDQNAAYGNFTTFSGLKPKLESGFFRSRVLRDKDMPPSGPLPQNSLDELSCWLGNNYPEN